MEDGLQETNAQETNAQGKAYKLNHNGELVKELPIENGAIPRGCIATPPPPEKDGFLRVWDGTTWGYSEWKQSSTAQRLESQARVNRDNLLAKTDWTQLSDVPKATREKWKAYRQALRDLPASDGWPQNIIWPIAPA